MISLFIPLLLIVAAGSFQGTFGLGMKKYQPLSWEGFWIIFSFIGMLIFPLLTAIVVVPSVTGAIGALPPCALALSVFMGACWGVGSIMFGRAVNYIGLSLAYGISMGLGAAVGSLSPLFGKDQLPDPLALWMILIGTAIMVGGVALISYAGMLRDKEAGGVEIKSLTSAGKFKIGLLFAIMNGVFSALLNIGYINAMPAADAAVQMGVLPREATIIPWVIVLIGGSLVNIIYSIVLLVKNKTYKTLVNKGNGKAGIWALATALMWFAALMFYGQGAALLGEYGTIVGWTMFLALALVVSNVWGMKSGEWKGFKIPTRTMLIGNVVLILSWIILGYANYLIG